MIFLLFTLSCGTGRFPIGQYKNLAGISLSPDGGTFYLLYTGIDNRSYLNVNGNVSGPFEHVFYHGFSPGGRFYAIYKKGDKLYFEYDGQTQEISADRVSSVEFSPDGGSYLIRAYSGAKQLLITESLTIGPFDTAEETSFPENGDLFGAIVKTAGVYQVWINGKKQGDYTFAEGLRFSDDGMHWGYTFALGAAAAVFADGIIIDELPHPAGPYFSPRGKIVYYASYGKDKITVLSNKNPIMEIPYDSSSLLIGMYIRDDGTIAGYTLGNAERFSTTLNGITYGTFDRWFGKIAVSPDGKDFVFYYEDNEMGYINRSGKLYGPFATEGHGKIHLSPGGRLFYAPYFGENAAQWIASVNTNYGPYSIIEKFNPARDYSGFVLVHTDMTSHFINLNGLDIAVSDNICDAVLLTNGNVRYVVIEDNHVQMKKWIAGDN